LNFYTPVEASALHTGCEPQSLSECLLEEAAEGLLGETVNGSGQ